MRRQRPWWADDVVAALPGWIVARVAVAVGFVVAIVVADKLLPGARPLQLDQGLFSWDAAFYRDIAERGYDGVATEALRFFPLVPILTVVLSLPLFGNVGLALILVSNVAALAAGALLHRLALSERGDQAEASRAAWLLALLPPSMVLVLGYSESTMLVCTIAGFLALRRRRWWAAALFGFLGGLSRPVGALMALPAAIEGVRGLREASAGERVARLAAVAAPALGVVSYLAWVHVRFGDWRLPIDLQGDAELRGEWVNPVVRIFQAIGGVVSGDDLLREGLHLPWILGFVALTVVAFRRWPVSYGAYAGALLLLALSSSNLGSFERYGLTAFPLLLALASVSEHRVVDRMVLTAAAAGLAGFTAMSMLGTFVP